MGQLLGAAHPRRIPKRRGRSSGGLYGALSGSRAGQGGACVRRYMRVRPATTACAGRFTCCAIGDDVLIRPHGEVANAVRRLYEQGADHRRLWRYAERWCRWRRAGLSGLVSLKGGLRRVVIRQLRTLGIVGFPIPKYDAQTGT